MPIAVKLKVLNAAFMSAIMYGCETWINIDLKPIQTLYYGAIKAALNVRLTTCNELSALEVGLPSLADYVKQKQNIFMCRALNEGRSTHDDSLMFAWNLNI